MYKINPSITSLQYFAQGIGGNDQNVGSRVWRDNRVVEVLLYSMALIICSTERSKDDAYWLMIKRNVHERMMFPAVYLKWSIYNASKRILRYMNTNISWWFVKQPYKGMKFFWLSPGFLNKWVCWPFFFILMHAFASRKNLNVAPDISRSPIRPSSSFHQLLFFLIPFFQLCLVHCAVLGPLIPAAIYQLSTVKE